MVRNEKIVSAAWLMTGLLAGAILASLPNEPEVEDVRSDSAWPSLLSPRHTRAQDLPWYPVAVKWRDNYQNDASEAAFEEAYRRIPHAPWAARAAATIHLADHWARTDPYGALSFALEQRDQDEGLLGELLVALAMHSPETVLARIDDDFQKDELARWLRLAGGDDDQKMVELVETYQLERFAPDIGAFADPDGALREAVALKDAEARRQATGRALVQWMLRHPESAMEALDRHVLEQDWAHVVTRLFWASPIENLDFIMDHFEVFEANMSDEFYVRIGTSLAYKDPDKAVDLAARLDSGNPRQTYLIGIANQPGHLDSEHFEALMNLVPSDSDSGTREYALGKLGGAWAQKDPEAAYRWAALNVTGPKERGSVLSEILREWHARDPEEAMRHIDALGDQDGWAAWPQFGVFKGKEILNREGVEALRQFLFELPPERRRLVSLTSLFEGRPASESAMLLAEMADAQAPVMTDDPSDSDNWNRIEEHEVTRAIEAWVVESPREAVEWASGQESESRLLHALTAWTDRNSVAALAEAERLGVEDQVRDHVAAKELRRMLELESKIDFPEAYAKERELARKGFNVPRVIERWMREDPEGALDALEKSGRGGTYLRETAERVAIIRAIREL